jgi:hypothetical protein
LAGIVVGTRAAIVDNGLPTEVVGRQDVGERARGIELLGF